MADEVTTVSWFSRIKDAFIGIFVGLALIIAAIVLLFWNEKNILHTAQSLEQTQKILLSVPNKPINPQNNLKVVYLSGMASTEDVLDDELLGLEINAIKLSRNVEMYQWEEKTETKTESQLGGSEKKITSHTYKKIWSDQLIDSSSFKSQEGHQNPSIMPITSQKQYAETVYVGDFLLPETLISEIDQSKPVNLSKVDKEALKEEFKKPVSLMNSQLYLGKDAQMPAIGDLRINVSAVYPQNVSVIGQQTEDTLAPYLAPAGETVLLLSTGILTPELMIKDALSQNTMMAWIFRLASLLMLIAGFSLILKPLVILADVVPFIGSIVGFGTGFIGFICGVSVWVVFVAIAWFATRPLLSLGSVVFLIIVSYVLIRLRAKKNA